MLSLPALPRLVKARILIIIIKNEKNPHDDISFTHSMMQPFSYKLRSNFSPSLNGVGNENSREGKLPIKLRNILNEFFSIS
jgi:hypothetical protein